MNKLEGQPSNAISKTTNVAASCLGCFLGKVGLKWRGEGKQ